MNELYVGLMSRNLCGLTNNIKVKTLNCLFVRHCSSYSTAAVFNRWYAYHGWYARCR